MEIVLWFIGIILAIVLLKFLFNFIIQITALGIGFGLSVVTIGGILSLIDVVEWETCCEIAKWGFWIGTAIGIVMFIRHPDETLSNVLEIMDGHNANSSNEEKSEWKERYSFYNENNTDITIERDSPNNSYDFHNITNYSEKWERIPGTTNFKRKY